MVLKYHSSTWTQLFFVNVALLLANFGCSEELHGLDDAKLRLARSLDGYLYTNANDGFGIFSNKTELQENDMRNLMALLKLGDSTKPACLNLDIIYKKNNLTAGTNVTQSTFKEICPTIIQQILSKSCSIEAIEKIKIKKTTPAEVWGYAILSVTIISLASLLGAFVVPFMNRDFYQKVLLFMVSVAVGVLGGSSIFHLIPGAFNFDPLIDNTYIWKGATIVGGIYFFFITESLMKIYIRFNDWKMVKSSSTTESNGTSVELTLNSLPARGNNCNHEHGLDSLHIAGDHQLVVHDSSDVFLPNNKNSKKNIAPVAWMIIIGDGLHNFIDGLAIGAAFTSSTLEGVSTSLAIFSEELPHELGDFAILLNSGMSYKQAMVFNFISACSCYLGMAIGISLGSTTSSVKWIYAVAAGMFLYISLVDMLPEATGMQISICGTSKKETWRTFALVNVGIILGFAIMMLLAIYGPMISL